MKLATGGGKLLPTLLVLGVLFYVISTPAKAAATFKQVAGGMGTVVEAFATFFGNIT